MLETHPATPLCFEAAGHCADGVIDEASDGAAMPASLGARACVARALTRVLVRMVAAQPRRFGKWQKGGRGGERVQGNEVFNAMGTASGFKEGRDGLLAIAGQLCVGPAATRQAPAVIVAMVSCDARPVAQISDALQRPIWVSWVRPLGCTLLRAGTQKSPFFPEILHLTY
jgi:hypothetical protein